MGADGKPMSKSRGNGVDPVRLMDDYGADGMRFGLLVQVTGAQDLKFNEEKLLASRNFANKVRNAARFVGMNLEGFTPGAPTPATPADRWIFSRLARLVARIDSLFETFEFGEITRELYAFFWNEFCDWYIEFAKARLAGADARERLVCQRNLVFVLDQAIRLLHPIMPFITEEIYQELPVDKEGAPYLIGAAWPCADALAAYADAEAERAIGAVCEAVAAVRSTRARYGISPKTPLALSLVAEPALATALDGQRALVREMANLSDLSIEVERDDVPAASGNDGPAVDRAPAQSAVVLCAGFEARIALQGLVDFEAERARLERERAKLGKDAERLARKLENPGFLAKAAPEIVEKDRARHAELVDKLARIEGELAQLA